MAAETCVTSGTGSVSGAAIQKNSAPKTSIHTVTTSVGSALRVRRIITVPAAQLSAASCIQATPSGRPASRLSS